jgi:hypothetical protein
MFASVDGSSHAAQNSHDLYNGNIRFDANYDYQSEYAGSDADGDRRIVTIN